MLSKIKNFLIGKPEPEIPELRRNAPCWCGSGQKYKKCHLEEDSQKKSKALAATCCTKRS